MPSPTPRLDAALLPLLRELGELKRIHSAGRSGSIAERLFAEGWRALIGGEAVETVALRITARALAATRLGDLDARTLVALRVPPERAIAISRAALAEVSMAINESLVAALRDALEQHDEPITDDLPLLDALAEQPRAGVTCPGKPRLMLQPVENHAEHSLAVAVYAVLLSPVYGGDAGLAFLAALAHHLHSAAMPDSGYAGEMLLGDDLLSVMDAARAEAMTQLPPALHRPIGEALALIADDRAPEAKAFHAADAIDRVLEIEQHLRVREATMRTVLDDYGLVHDGPVKPFHDRVLAEIGLA